MAQKKKEGAAAERRPSMDDDPVVRALLRAISLKRIKPGTKLVADQLVQAFGSNRIHIRQVFEHLASRGIIQHIPNRGAFVAQPSVEEARQVFATRRILECAAVRDVVDRLDESMIASLRAHAAREHDHSGEEDRWSTLTLTGEFHSLIGHLTGNEVLAKLIDELALRTSLIIATFERHGGSDDCSPSAHPDIVGRILERDREGAVAAMKDHLIAMEARLQLDRAPERQKDLTTIFAEMGMAGEQAQRN